MATYLEIHQLIADNNLRNRFSTAAIVSATAFLTSGTSTAAQKRWATAVMEDPISWGQKVMTAALSLNKSSSVAQITGASDNAIQNNVDSVAPAFAETF